MKFKGKQAFKNIAFMYLAQMAQMLLSITMSVYVPMSIGLTEFSYWQLFIFYSSYVGMLHIGLNDGIYLNYGGRSLTDDEKLLVSNQLWMSMIAQISVLLLLFVVLLASSSSPERIFVFSAVLLYAVVGNIFNFCGSTLQALNKIRVYSVAVVSDKLFVIASIFTLTYWGERHFQVLIACYIVGKTIATLTLLITNKEFFIRRLKFGKNIIHEIVSNVKIGSNLMVANIASSLVIGIGRFFIDLNYSVETFGIISFAFTMTGFVLALISQVGNSVFPILKAKAPQYLIEIYPRLNHLLSALLPLSYLIYPVIALFVKTYLPQYKESLVYFALVLPLCVFEAKISMLYNTFMKVLRKEQMLLVCNLAALFCSFILVLISVYVMNSLVVLVAGLVLSVVLKSVGLHLFICRTMNLPWKSNVLFYDFVVSIISVTFLCSDDNWWHEVVGMFLIMSIYCLLIAKSVSKDFHELFVYREL